MNRWSERFLNASLGAIVSVVLTGLLSVVEGFRDDVTRYPAPELIAGAAAFGVLLLAEGVTGWGRRSLRQRLLDAAPYGAALMFFFVVTVAVVPDRGELGSSPIWAALGLLGLLHLVRIRARLSGGTDAPVTGLACTSVLVQERAGAEVGVLVLNKNLNSGKGLWVSPGGHFDVTSEEPTAKLQAKIRSEVGMEADIWHPGTPDIDEVRRYSTTETRWLIPPLFLLNEDLLGRCSLGHARHLDLVYACVVRTEIPGAHVKYGGSERVYVPLAACAASAEAAEQAMNAAVRTWHRDRFGAEPGRVDTLSKDVAQRLHLVAARRAATP